VAERHELVAEDRARPDPPDVHRHTAAVMDVEARLRTILRRVHDDRRRRGKRQVPLLRLGRESAEGGCHLFERRFLRELQRHHGGVAVGDRHARRRRADGERRVANHAVVVRAEQLAGFRLDFLFLAAADIRDHVAERVERRDAGIARARKRLQRRHDDTRDLELPQAGEYHGDVDGGAVRVGHDAARALEAARAALIVEQRQMIRVDLRDQQRHQRIHPVVARVADDQPSAAGEGRFRVTRDRRVERREDE